MDYLIGIDIGTTGVRSIIIDREGMPIAQDRIGYEYRGDCFGVMQQDADLYYRMVKQTIRNVVQIGGIEPGRVAGIGISGMAPDALPIDVEGSPLYPAILWMDRRAVKEADVIRKKIGDETVFEISGNCIDPYYAIVKILWIKGNEPDVYRKAYKILNIKDYIVGRLTGKFVTDFSHAGLAGIAYDIRRQCWNREIVRDVDLDISKLPDPYPGEEVVGRVTESAARSFGLIEGIPVVAGMIDSAASYLACGIIDSGDSAMSLGTSSCWGIYHEEDVFTKSMNITNAPWKNGAFLTNASQASSGAIFNWLKDTFLGSAVSKKDEEDERFFDKMEKMAQKLYPGCDGLLTLPYFMGERTPLWDPYARGVFFGLTLHHSLGHLYRSVAEAMGFNFLASMLLIEKAGLRLRDEVIITGGCAKSPLIRKVLADILNLRILHISDEKGAVYADAWLSGKGVGIFSDYSGLQNKRKIVSAQEPDPELNILYRDIYEKVYRLLYPRLKGLYRGLKKYKQV